MKWILLFFFRGEGSFRRIDFLWHVHKHTLGSSQDCSWDWMIWISGHANWSTVFIEWHLLSNMKFQREQSMQHVEREMGKWVLSVHWVDEGNLSFAWGGEEECTLSIRGGDGGAHIECSFGFLFFRGPKYSSVLSRRQAATDRPGSRFLCGLHNIASLESLTVWILENSSADLHNWNWQSNPLVP